MLLYLPEAPFLRILKRTSNSIYPTFYPTQKKKELIISSFFHNLVPRTGIEPARLAAHAPETCASTYSATWAFGNCGVQK